MPLSHEHDAAGILTALFKIIATPLLNFSALPFWPLKCDLFAAVPPLILTTVCPCALPNPGRDVGPGTTVVLVDYRLANALLSYFFRSSSEVAPFFFQTEYFELQETRLL